MKDTKELKFDVIGDIHGCATELEELLISLGYLEIGRCFRRSDGRRVVFLGDYIDRGLEVRRTLEIVRSMVDNGQAYAILGNHELNALRFHQRGPDGEWMRPHTPSKVSQHQSTLDQIVHPDPISWRKWMDWFAELPLWLEFPEFRVVHAAWFDRDVALLDRHGPLKGNELNRLSAGGTLEALAVERLSCGLELSLPEGEYFETGDAVRRTVFRTRWWEHLRGKACSEVVFPPDRRISGAACSPPSWHRPYPETAKPVFFGHFAVSDEELAPIAPNVACLDYGMGKGGRLVAYRWDGEATLMREKFVTAH